MRHLFPARRLSDTILERRHDLMHCFIICSINPRVSRATVGGNCLTGYLLAHPRVEVMANLFKWIFFFKWNSILIGRAQCFLIYFRDTNLLENLMKAIYRQTFNLENIQMHVFMNVRINFQAVHQPEVRNPAMNPLFIKAKNPTTI